MPGMSPDEMAAMQSQAGKENAGAITKVAQQVGEGLAKLSDALNGSQAATDADKEQMAQIMSLYVDLVEKKLGSTEPGQEAPDDSPQMAQVPMDAGAKGKPMGPQTRN